MSATTQQKYRFTHKVAPSDVLLRQGHDSRRWSWVLRNWRELLFVIPPGFMPVVMSFDLTKHITPLVRQKLITTDAIPSSPNLIFPLPDNFLYKYFVSIA